MAIDTYQIYALWLLLSYLISDVEAFVSPTKHSTRQRQQEVFSSQQQWRLTADASSFTTSSTTEGNSDTTTSLSSFVTSVFQCFIEDTDAYGVMYNSNYLRSYDRALHSLYDAMEEDVLVGQKEEKSSLSSLLDTHEDWAIVRVTNQKFKSSPKLGGKYCVHGTLVEQNAVYEVWDVTMKESELSESTLYNEARVTIARPGTFVDPPKVLWKDMEQDGSSMVTHKDQFRLFRDEFDVHFPTHLPLRNVLNVFERSRSNFLGGPDSLRKLQEDHRLLFVVTKIDNCCKFPADDEVHLRPGQIVVVDTTFAVKRKGMIIECHHTLIGCSRPMAQASVTLMTLDADTFKPTTNLPDWLLKIMMTE